MRATEDKTLIINRLKSALNIKTNADLARHLHIAPNTLTNWYKRNTLDYDSIFTHCGNINTNWLLFGTGDTFNYLDNSDNLVKELPHPEYSSCKKCIEKDKIIELLQDNIKTQQKLIKNLEEKIETITKSSK